MAIEISCWHLYLTEAWAIRIRTTDVKYGHKIFRILQNSEKVETEQFYKKSVRYPSPMLWRVKSEATKVSRFWVEKPGVPKD